MPPYPERVPVCALCGEEGTEDSVQHEWGCGRTALNVPGDFVECGVYKGLYSAMLTQYLDWAKIDRRFYLYDTFTGLPEEWSSQQEWDGVNQFFECEGTYE